MKPLEPLNPNTELRLLDVNVLSWNTKRAFLILSGADDGQFRVWDFRSIKFVFSFILMTYSSEKKMAQRV